MLLEKERFKVVQFGKKLISSRLTAGTGGNLSCINRREQKVAISPSGIDYEEMLPEDVIITNTTGQVLDGRLKPSSEIGIHLGLYLRRPDIKAVVHTHSVYATTIACLGLEIPPVHYLVGFSGKKVPIAPYSTFGSPELCESVFQNIGDYNALLMANHGLIAVGTNMLRAFSTAEEIEFVARIYYQTLNIGKPIILSDEEMEKVIEKFAFYGQKKK